MIRVKLIGITQHLDSDGEPERLIAQVGRESYIGASEEELISFIQARIRQGREGVLEHVYLTFDISGVSFICSHRLVQCHAGFSSASLGAIPAGDFCFTIPPGIIGKSTTRVIFDRLLMQATKAYELLRELGVRVEDCCFLLPGATVVRMIATMNLHELRSFFKDEYAGPAQWEARMVADRMLEIAYGVVPSAFEALYTMNVKGKEY